MSINNLTIGDNISTNDKVNTKTKCDCVINEKICNQCNNYSYIESGLDSDTGSELESDSDLEMYCYECNDKGPNCRNMECDFFNDKYHDVLIRGKYLFNNCQTFDDMIQVLKFEIKHLEYFRDNGWKIREYGMQDDYCNIYNDDFKKYDDYENAKIE